METTQFLQLARERLDKDPNTRLTPLAKNCLEDKNCIVDIHTHIFDKRCLSIRYIALRMLKSLALSKLGIEANNVENQFSILNKDEKELYNDIEKGVDDSESDWEQLEKELEMTTDIYETYEIFGYDVKEALKVLRKKSMKEVLKFYHEDYAITNLEAFKGKEILTGVLQMDLETGWNFSPRRRFRQQILDIQEITKEYPIIPFLALDARRADAAGSENNLYELFLEAFTNTETPFFGVKCYPALGFLPSDVRLDPIFEICAEFNIPVLTHCGGETVSTYEKIIEIKDSTGYNPFLIPGEKRNVRARYLNEPDLWIPVLEKHQNLKLNFGHFGGDDFWLDRSKIGSNSRITKIFEMMLNPKYRVYGDFSFNLVEPELFDVFKSELDNNPTIAKRTLYGTDYWVVLPAGALLKEQEAFLKKMGVHQNAMLRDNAIEYLLK